MTEQVRTPLGARTIHRLSAHQDPDRLAQIPYSIRVLLESVIRNQDGLAFTPDNIAVLANYEATNVGEVETPFMPGRVILQDFTGVPAVVDLAAMRSAIVRMTGDVSSAQKVNPLVPCDLVIDHSVQVDAFGSDLALKINSRLEFERNRERYEFLKWGQQAFDNFRVVPPATGIVHQVNLEYLAKVVWDNGSTLYPDSLVGTDSHTTMINGLGVVGWGVGGIEAEAVMVGQPIYMLVPEVVGFRLTGRLPNGATATDAVLRITEMLRKHGVVGKFVEFFGPGLGDMPLANRATIANMAPEYGATVGFFPVDDQTTRYLRQTGRDEALIEAVEWYYREQGLWRHDNTNPSYSSMLHLDLASVVPALAGPKRPQDRIDLTAMQTTWERDLRTTFGRPEPVAAHITYDGHEFDLEDGDVVIAAITSCTNTSNPSVMIGAGLLARNAATRGLTRKPWVKTSLAPGSKVVTDYLDEAGLSAPLAALGFHTVGYGCTTCIGNSGPLPDEIAAGVEDKDLVVTSVLSGNRNFEGRISPHVKANYLASPPLVVAYALAGTVDIDFDRDPIGLDSEGSPVMLAEIWPSSTEIESVVATSVQTGQFTHEYGNVFLGSEEWQDVGTSAGALYEWDASSTYVQEPPFFDGLSPDIAPISPITGARVLAKLGDSVTTDHISPAGSIALDSPAGRHLVEQGVAHKDFNSYGSRRGNDRVMTRGTFANIRVRNQLAPGTEGGWTTDLTTGAVTSIHEASLSYREAGIPLVVLAGVDYGMGSSRDWAAKGTYLLGVRAVIAKSFERIHRSNLIGMGVLPLTFLDGVDADSLGLDGTETFAIEIRDDVQPRQAIPVTATRSDGSEVRFETTCRLDTPVEVQYYRNGGILHTVLLRMAEPD